MLVKVYRCPPNRKEYCIHGMEHLVFDDNDPNLQMFVNAFTAITLDMNLLLNKRFVYDL